MIKVEKIPGKGRCIVATQSIPLGTLIEHAPVSAFSSTQHLISNNFEVFQYFFVQPQEYNQEQSSCDGYLVFGLSSLCSHHDHPNAGIEWIEDEVGWWANLIAKKEIKPGEEVTLFYTNIAEYTNIDEFI
ncbi:MAG: SET domain-containing protein-lysine N-methyltransferase [Leptolyngbyaceae cyanobacterium]